MDITLNVHNWDRQNEPVTLRIWVDQIDAQTDLSSSDLQTGLPRSWQPNPSEKDERKRQPPPVSLLKAELTSSAGDHVFAGETPTIVFRLWDWSQQPRKAKVFLFVRDFVGEKVFGEDREINPPGFAEEVFTMPTKKFGCYQAEATLTTSDGTKCLKRLAFAFIPPPRELTETEGRRRLRLTAGWANGAKNGLCLFGCSGQLSVNSMSACFLAWSPDGLYIAAEVRNSVVKVVDSQSFWTGDCIELFADTRNDKRHRALLNLETISSGSCRWSAKDRSLLGSGRGGTRYPRPDMTCPMSKVP